MTDNKQLSVIPDEAVINKIYFIRNEKIMLDRDLAELYGVETKRLNEQVKRNIDRFPEDFMFQLTEPEFENLKSQIATSSWGGTRYPPFLPLQVFPKHRRVWNINFTIKTQGLRLEQTTRKAIKKVCTLAWDPAKVALGQKRPERGGGGV